jgi:hypothetical protein
VSDSHDPAPSFVFSVLPGIKKGERILCKTRNPPIVYESPEFVEDYQGAF